MESLIQFFGRVHPMVLHAPIGLLIGFVALEGMGLASGRPLDPRVRSILAWLTAVSAAVSAGSGLVLSLEDSYDRSAIQLHQWLGIGVAAGCILAAVLQQAKWTGAFRVVLLLAAGAIVPAGHLGAGITHGTDFLTAPFEHRTKEVAQPATSTGAPVADSEYARVIVPILQSRCAGCHGASKQKGGLALHTPDAIRKGGKDGPALVAGNVETSEMVCRLRLPIDDEDHMPPEAKAQPTPDEVRAIEEWIKAGASFEAPHTTAIPVAEAPAPTAPPAAEKPATPAPSGPPPADAGAINAMRQALVHVEPVEQGSNLLFVDFAAVASSMAESELARLLEPVCAQVAELSLARSKAGDALMTVAARMPNLTHLNVSGTAVSDAGIAALAGHPRLVDLVLTMTKLTDAAVPSLVAMPALKHVYLWKSGISPDSLAPLREHDVAVDTGEAQAAKPLETEAEIKLTGTAPAADLLKPVNTMCPVLGNPIDPKYSIVYKGRVIGFCCPHCPGEFWADPDKYASKLP